MSEISFWSEFLQTMVGMSRSTISRFKIMVKVGAWFKATPFEWDDELNQLKLAQFASKLDLKDINMKIQFPVIIAEVAFLLCRFPALFSNARDEPVSVANITVHCIWMCEFFQGLVLTFLIHFKKEEICSACK